MCKKFFSLLILLGASGYLFAQTEDTKQDDKADLPIYFRYNSDLVDPTYKDNQSALDKANEMISDSTVIIDSLTMVATTSPEGNVEYNTKLAQRRAQSMANFFSDNLPAVSERVRTSTSLYTWKDLADRIRNDENVPNKDAVMNILNRDISSNRVKSFLQRIDGGKAYNYLEDNYLSNMRSASNVLLYYVQEPMPLPVIEEPDTTPKYINVRMKYPVFALRTSLLFPLSNIGFEVPIGNRYSFAADWYTPWLFRKSDHRNCFQLQFANFEGKYWFGSKHSNADIDNRQYRLTGHALGVYLYGGKYDFEKKWAGHQGEFWSAGVDYTYAIPGWKGRLRWEFNLSVGYFRNQSYAYDVFTEGGKLYTRSLNRRYANYFGPTKIAISLVVPFFKHYNKLVKEEVQ